MPRPFINSSFTASRSGAGVEGWGAGEMAGASLWSSTEPGFSFPLEGRTGGGGIPKHRSKRLPELPGTLLRQLVAEEHPNSDAYASGSQQVLDKCCPPGATQAPGSSQQHFRELGRGRPTLL